VARYVQKKAALSVQSLRTVPELLDIAPQILQTYNQSFIHNWEYYPLSEREIRFVIDELRPIAIPQLAIVVKRQEEFVGFALALPDLSPVLRRWGGRLHPLSLLDLWRNKRHPQSLILTVMGMIDPEHAQGGAALLMAELEQQARALGIARAEFVNVADTAVQMRRILTALGMQAHKRHRVYEKEL
jgi:GNAT superfamily N-acetyltransferase